jgi:Thioredoxin-like
MASQKSESKASSLPAAPTVSTPTWSELLGPQLLASSKEPAVSTEDLLKEVDFVLLYFSASWCPPCQGFSPVLKVFYQSINDIPIVGTSTSTQPTTSTAVVYVSSDHSASTSEFAKYCGTISDGMSRAPKYCGTISDGMSRAPTTLCVPMTAVALYANQILVPMSMISRMELRSAPPPILGSLSFAP